MYHDSPNNILATSDAEDILNYLNNKELHFKRSYLDYRYETKLTINQLTAQTGVRKPMSARQIAAKLLEIDPTIYIPSTPTGLPSITKDFLASLTSTDNLDVLEFVSKVTTLRNLSHNISNYPSSQTISPQYEIKTETTGGIFSNSPNIQSMPDIYRFLDYPNLHKIDFKQQELHLLGKLARDDKLLSDLQQQDFFQALADKRGISREVCKRDTYAGIYGYTVYPFFRDEYPLSSKWLGNKLPKTKNYPIHKWASLYLYDMLLMFGDAVLIPVHDAVVLSMESDAIEYMMEVFDLPYNLEEVIC